MIAVLGEGAWGTAFATLLAENGHEVALWCYHAEVCEQILQTRYNTTYLPDITLSDRIHPVTDIKEAVQSARWVFEAIPVKFLRSVLEQARPYYTSEQTWVLLSKGIEQDTLLFPGQMLEDVFQTQVAPVACMGPSFAYELARKQMTSFTIASHVYEKGNELQTLLSNEYVCAERTDDVAGVQICAALKNVLALGVGILTGAGYGDNARAFFITRGLAEMRQLVCALGGQEATAYGLSGVGDLVLTSLGQRSRNVMVGQAVGKGESLAMILQRTGFIPEGVNTVKSIFQLQQQKKITLPICTGVYQMVFEALSPQQLISTLMNKI